MVRAVVKQRYFVATQKIEDGKTILTLLEEAKDTGACHNLVRSKEFIQKYMALNLPIRVCILRDEPAFMVQARPNELALKIRASAGERADDILAIMAAHGVNVTGDADVAEVASSVYFSGKIVEAPADTQEPQGATEAQAPMPEPKAQPTAMQPPPGSQQPPPAVQQPPAAPAPEIKEVKYLDQLRIVPANYQVLGHGALLVVAQKIDATIDGTCTKLACMAVIGKYLETGQRSVGKAPQAPPPPPPMPTQSALEAAMDMPPAQGFQQHGFQQVVCSGTSCGAVVWKGPGDKMYDAVPGYPEHNCPDYVRMQAERQSAAMPPVPPGPPAAAVKASPPPPMQPPPAVAPSGGFTYGRPTSGQAPLPPRDLGVPPGPPPPPPPPPPVS